MKFLLIWFSLLVDVFFIKFDQLFLVLCWGLKSLFSYLNLNYILVLIFRKVSVRVFSSTMLEKKKNNNNINNNINYWASLLNKEK